MTSKLNIILSILKEYTQKLIIYLIIPPLPLYIYLYSFLSMQSIYFYYNLLCKFR